MNAWRTEVVGMLLLLLVVAIVGATSGWFWPLLILLLLLMLGYEIFQISRFESWIRTGGRGRYPKAKGIWEDIYYHIYRLKKNDKKRKKKLGKMVDLFRKSTEALPDAAVVLGQYDEIEWSNKIAKQVLGIQQTDKGQRIPNLIRFPEFVNYLKSGDFEQAITLPSPVDKHMTLTFRIVAYGDGLRLLLAQDVTQLKKMELMRKDFVANVSHELRTPLTVLKGYLETLRDMDEGKSLFLTESLQQMQGQTERMQHLVDDLLLLTRLETQHVKTECVAVAPLLKQICQEFDALESQNQRITLSLETSADLLGDEQELRSAFTNLLGNAFKYSPAETPVKLRWYRAPHGLVLAVEDQGEGIAANEISRVTERFYRCEVKRSHKVSGTGLGLAIVKHVLMRHEAHLQIVSDVGKGSTFSCHFPVSRIC